MQVSASISRRLGISLRRSARGYTCGCSNQSLCSCQGTWCRAKSSSCCYSAAPGSATGREFNGTAGVPLHRLLAANEPIQRAARSTTDGAEQHAIRTIANAPHSVAFALDLGTPGCRHPPSGLQSHTGGGQTAPGRWPCARRSFAANPALGSIFVLERSAPALARQGRTLRDRKLSPATGASGSRGENGETILPGAPPAASANRRTPVP